MKKILAIIISIFMISSAYGATVSRTEIVGSFVVTVMRDGEPVREIGDAAVMPFNTEYELLLKNNNNRRAVAHVTIDGSNISNFGDLVIPAQSSVLLKRYILTSLTEGKAFKFVSLDTPGVDDPTRKENGMVRVEFRVENKPDYIYWDCNNYILTTADSSITINATDTVVSNNTDPGATIGGSHSSQQFHKTEIDLEDETWIVEIELRGVRE